MADNRDRSEHFMPQQKPHEIVPGHRLRCKGFETQHVYLCQPNSSERWLVSTLSSPMPIDGVVNQWVDATLNHIESVGQLNLIVYVKPEVSAASVDKVLAGKVVTGSFLTVETRTLVVLYTVPVEQGRRLYTQDTSDILQGKSETLEPEKINVRSPLIPRDEPYTVPVTLVHSEKADKATGDDGAAQTGADGSRTMPATPGETVAADTIAARPTAIDPRRNRQRVRIPDFQTTPGVAGH